MVLTLELSRTLLPSRYFWFYKFTSEDIRCILITPKTKVVKLWAILSFRKRELCFN